MRDLIFANPAYFWLLLLIPAMILWQWKVGEKKQPRLLISTIQGLTGKNRTAKYRLRHLPFLFRIATLMAVICALARPQSTSQSENVYTEGIDIVLAMDISSSMLAQDFRPNRLEAAKDVALQFIADRPSDRLGVVVFAGESFTQCPLTTDRIALINLMKDIESGLLVDGTAIGNGLATAVNRLKDSKGKSKVIILLTDGVNNSGEVPPLTAAELAKTYGIRVYTIGVGSMGTAPYPVMTPYGVQLQQMPVEIDEDILKETAKITGGAYFRATNNTKLLDIYKQINQLEKTKVEVSAYNNFKEEYTLFALFALVFFVLEALSKLFIFNKIP